MFKECQYTAFLFPLIGGSNDFFLSNMSVKILIYLPLSNSEHTTEDATGMQYLIPPTVPISLLLTSLFMKNKQTHTPLKLHHFLNKLDL